MAVTSILLLLSRAGLFDIKFNTRLVYRILPLSLALELAAAPIELIIANNLSGELS